MLYNLNQYLKNIYDLFNRIKSFIIIYHNELLIGLIVFGIILIGYRAVMKKTNRIYNKNLKKDCLKIQDRIDKLESKIEANKAYSILMVVTISFTLIGILINNLIVSFNNNDGTKVQRQMNNVVITELSKNYEKDYSIKSDILNNYKDYLKRENTEQVDNDSLLEDIYKLKIEDENENFKAIELLEKYDGVLFEKSLQDKVSIETIGKFILLSIVIVFIILLVVQDGLSYEIYQVKILKKLLEDKEKSERVASEKLDNKHKLLLELYKEYQQSVPKLCIKHIIDKMSEKYSSITDKNEIREILKKLKNEKLILCADEDKIDLEMDQEITLTTNGIEYIEEFVGIDKYLKSNDKILKIEEGGTLPYLKNSIIDSIVLADRNRKFIIIIIYTILFLIAYNFINVNVGLFVILFLIIHLIFLPNNN